MIINAGDRVIKTTASVVYNLEEKASIQSLQKPIIINCDKTYEERYSRQKNALKDVHILIPKNVNILFHMTKDLCKCD